MEMGTERRRLGKLDLFFYVGKETQRGLDRSRQKTVARVEREYIDNGYRNRIQYVMIVEELPSRD